ncbi:MAG: histidine phosphatase family protein [Ruminococcaceae bacterium]|nr:histidine phosphatase family protein [Oscillospiraceae bacterium]
MKIYFVRHGHPDYKTDSLTELGKKQAAAAAIRLKDCGIERIYSSTKGRALQTAEYTAGLLNVQVIPCDFMREISWASIDEEPIVANGHPWLVADIRASEGKSILERNWQEVEPYSKSKAVSCYDTVVQGLDGWLAELGYNREGDYYRVSGADTYKTVAMFSHGGSSSAALSHLLNIPFPQFCGAFHIDFTSVTIVELPNEIGKLVYPKIELFNDAKHICGISD